MNPISRQRAEISAIPRSPIIVCFVTVLRSANRFPSACPVSHQPGGALIGSPPGTDAPAHTEANRRI